MTDPDTIEMEAAPETARYRHLVRMRWQALRSQYAEQLADAKLRGFAEEAARKAAASTVRRDVRLLMSELLTRAPVPALLEFLAGGRQWGAAGERLLEHSDVVTGLLESAYPRPTWTALAVLDARAAGDDARWSAWVKSWMEGFRATGAAAYATLVRKDEPSSRGWWAPWLTCAAATAAVTTVIVVATKE